MRQLRDDSQTDSTGSTFERVCRAADVLNEVSFGAAFFDASERGIDRLEMIVGFFGEDFE